MATEPAPLDPGALPWLSVPLHAVVLSDDDGSRCARVDRTALAAAVEFANRTFAPARVRFRFHPERSVTSARNSLLNGMSEPPIQNWPQAKAAGDQLAANHPGTVVVLLRYGPGAVPVGNGFAGIDHAFVVMPGTEDACHCGHPHTDALAHELGHYLGLDHTFAGAPFEDVPAAERFFLANDRDASVFDGDGLADTPPDPGIRSLECRRVTRVTLAGRRFELPRRNIMSYYDERDSLTPEQIARARWMLEDRLAVPARMRRVNHPPPGAMAAELLVASASRGASPMVQPMAGYGPGDWSGDAQLFVAAVDGAEISLQVHADPGVDRIILHATRAPDFGRLRAYVDGKAAGDPLDLYAPWVLPSGPHELRMSRQGSGNMVLTLRVEGRNEASTGFNFGIDTVVLAL